MKNNEEMNIYSDIEFNDRQKRIIALMEKIHDVIIDSPESNSADIVDAALCTLLASQIRYTCKKDVSKQDQKISAYSDLITKALIFNGTRREN